MLESIPSPVPVVASNALYEIADAWLAQLDDRVRAGEISQATRDNYAQGFQRFAAFADRTPITGTLVLNWIAALRAQNLKPASINTWLSGVRSLFRYAAAYAGLTVDPTKGIRGTRRAGTTKRHKTEILTNAEMQRVLDAPADTPIGKRDRAILMLMAYTAARTVEVWRADLENLTTVQGSLVLFVHGKGHTSADDVIVVAHPDAQTALYEWLAERGDKPGPLFTSLSKRSNGGRLSRSYLRRVVKSYFRAAGVRGENKRTHSLRHTAATNAIHNGATVQQVQAMLRHANITTTMIYFHETQRIENPAERLISYGESQ